MKVIVRLVNVFFVIGDIGICENMSCLLVLLLWEKLKKQLWPSSEVSPQENNLSRLDKSECLPQTKDIQY